MKRIAQVSILLSATLLLGAAIRPRTKSHDGLPVHDWGSIEWRNVKVSPGASEDYPVESSHSHYYAARRTDAAPLESPSQKEKFLFYRGLGSFAPSITATSSDDGAILVKNPGGDEIGGL